jgi:hypothetical protein
MLTFRAEPLAKVKRAIAIINERIQQGSRPNVTVNLPNDAGRRGSAADEFTKLAKLRRDGIITQAEFDAAKKKLLELG